MLTQSKGMEFEGTETEAESLDSLKKSLASDQIMSYFDPAMLTEVITG